MEDKENNLFALAQKAYDTPFGRKKISRHVNGCFVIHGGDKDIIIYDTPEQPDPKNECKDTVFLRKSIYLSTTDGMKDRVCQHLINVLNHTLHFHLKAEWFFMIKDGSKRIEYREITPYWSKLLIMPVYNDKDIEQHLYDKKLYEESPEKYAEFVEANIECGSIEFRKWVYVDFALGYPKFSDIKKHIGGMVKSIDIGTANPEWVPSDTPKDKKFYRIHF